MKAPLSRRPLRAAAAAVIIGAACTDGFSCSSSSHAARVGAPIRAEKNGADFSHLESATPSSRRKQEIPPSSPLRMICDEQKEFEMALGKAVDTLRKDYPDMLTSSPDFSIYHNDLETVDPSGVKLHGIRGYKTSFRFLHAFINFFYCPKESGLTFRLVYDWARNHIRVSWNAVLVPKKIYGGVSNMLHVDGISVYEMNKASGLITKHRIETLMLNDRPVKPVKGIFHAIDNLVPVDPEGIPVLGMKYDDETNPFVVEFRGTGGIESSLFGTSNKESSLFSMSDASSGEAESVGEREGNSLFDQEAFDRKNNSRKKFGLPPLSVQEFEEVQAQIRQMEIAQRQKAAAITAANAEFSNRKEKKEGFFSKMLGGILENTCESNWDCQRPEICCDLGFKKMCCSSGVKVFNGAPGQQYKRVLVPVPVDTRDGPIPPDAF